VALDFKLSDQMRREKRERDTVINRPSSYTYNVIDLKDRCYSKICRSWIAGRYRRLIKRNALIYLIVNSWYIPALSRRYFEFDHVNV
jgi:hypothetical protein